MFLQIYRSGCAPLSRVIEEAFLSHKAGVLTRSFLAQMRPEKSVESYPSLAISMIMVPLTCCVEKGTAAGKWARIVALTSMCMSAASVALFAYTEFDLAMQGHVRLPQKSTDLFDIEHHDADMHGESGDDKDETDSQSDESPAYRDRGSNRGGSDDSEDDEIRSYSRYDQS